MPLELFVYDLDLLVAHLASATVEGGPIRRSLVRRRMRRGMLRLRIEFCLGNTPTRREPLIKRLLALVRLPPGKDPVDADIFV